MLDHDGSESRYIYAENTYCWQSLRVVCFIVAHHCGGTGHSLLRYLLLLLSLSITAVGLTVGPIVSSSLLRQ